MKEINELKASAYDMLSNIQYLERKLQEINIEIQKKVTEFNEANKKLASETNEE